MNLPSVTLSSRGKSVDYVSLWLKTHCSYHDLVLVCNECFYFLKKFSVLRIISNSFNFLYIHCTQFSPITAYVSLGVASRAPHSTSEVNLCLAFVPDDPLAASPVCPFCVLELMTAVISRTKPWVFCKIELFSNKVSSVFHHGAFVPGFNYKWWYVHFLRFQHRNSLTGQKVHINDLWRPLLSYFYEYTTPRHTYNINKPNSLEYKELNHSRLSRLPENRQEQSLTAHKVNLDSTFHFLSTQSLQPWVHPVSVSSN